MPNLGEHMKKIDGMKWAIVYFDALLLCFVVATPFVMGGGWSFLVWLCAPIPAILLYATLCDPD